MNFSLRNLKNGVSRISHEEWLLAGIMLLGFLLLGILMWDVYLFSRTLSQEQRAIPAPPPLIIVSSQDIDEALRILDERQKNFNEILQK